MPIEHAKKAYSEGYFLEAIQVVHGFLELQMRELIYLQKKKHPALMTISIQQLNLCIPYHSALLRKSYSYRR
jgi:hypothetical protein